MGYERESMKDWADKLAEAWDSQHQQAEYQIAGSITDNGRIMAEMHRKLIEINSSLNGIQGSLMDGLIRTTEAIERLTTAIYIIGGLVIITLVLLGIVI